MKNELTTNVYLLPEHWLSALINDDYSGLSDQEEKEIRNFLDKTPGYPLCPDNCQRDFSPSNDAGTLACDCINVTFMIK